MKRIILGDLYPFYLGYRATESWKDNQSIVKVDCGCDGQMIPGNKFRMNLCQVHEAKAQTQ